MKNGFPDSATEMDSSDNSQGIDKLSNPIYIPLADQANLNVHAVTQKPSSILPITSF